VKGKVEVLDASALLALLQDEPGAETVHLEGAVINSVNFAEVVQKSIAKGKPVKGLLAELRLLGLEVTSFTPEEGLIAGELYPETRSLGLSLADRACLATARLRGGAAVTADRAWQQAEHGIPVRVIR
jgi:ribonuclease VapC